MTQKEIQSGNLLIAKFMGEGFAVDGMNPLWLHKHYQRKSIKFHSSFDWIMPVVVKIESGGNIRVKIEGYLCDIYQTKRNPKKKENGGFEDILLVSEKHNDKNTLIWMAIVKYIKWYYGQNKKINSMKE